MSGKPPIIWWVRRDLRLADNPALAAAAQTGCPIIPVFVLDACANALGAAPKWRLGLGLAALANAIETGGARLILRRGPALEQLVRLVGETGAQGVYWNRLYDPQARARDKAVKAELKSHGIAARSFGGHLLFEPWEVETRQGGGYRVFTPFWRAVKDLDVPGPAPAPRLTAPASWPESAYLSDWRMGAAMHRGAEIVARHVTLGEQAAQDRLDGFIARGMGAYAVGRDFPAQHATSRQSENLTYGEIGPRTVWHAGLRAQHEGRAGADAFLRQLVWREFAYHLLYHTPHIMIRNWRNEWDRFPWRDDNSDAERWRQGRTGVPLVDAAMREMYVTGTMHNRARMIAASYLTKHLLTHWRVGQEWFEECLIDWDPAANALGWQWVAGSGPDAAPYFRIFNPETQAAKFDPEGVYQKRFVAELSPEQGRDALDYFHAIPVGWGLLPDMPYPDPAIGLKAGRVRALEAYHGTRG